MASIAAAPQEIPTTNFLFVCQTKFHGDRFFVGHLLDLVDNCEVEFLGDDASTDALHLVGIRFCSLTIHSQGDHWDLALFNRDEFNRFIRLIFDVARYAGDRSAVIPSP